MNTDFIPPGLMAVLVFIWMTGLTIGHGQQLRVCVTVDDLPATGNSPEIYAKVLEKLTNFFSLHKIPAIGFVNEYKLYQHDSVSPHKVQLLENWLARDLELGNHTFSHISIDSASLEEYKEDVLNGEKILRPLLSRHEKQLTFFRHTQLRTGPTERYRRELNQFLFELGYRVAPVTIDNDEYIYAFCYARATPAMKQRIAADYLRYMSTIVAHFEKVAEEVVGADFPQILLIHANELNADYLEDLMNLFKGRGYTFISLREALEHPAYDLPKGTHARGLSWLYRWMLQKGMTIPDTPQVSPFISDLFSQLR